MRFMLMRMPAPSELPPDSLFHDWYKLDPQLVVIVCCLLAVSLGIFIWAAFFRKPGPHPHYHFHRHHAPSPPQEGTPAGWSLRRLFSRKRHHRRHHRQRPRNPTLAEAGGLPPIRSEDQPPPSN